MANTRSIIIETQILTENIIIRMFLLIQDPFLWNIHDGWEYFYQGVLLGKNCDYSAIFLEELVEAPSFRQEFCLKVYILYIV